MGVHMFMTCYWDIKYNVMISHMCIWGHRFYPSLTVAVKYNLNCPVYAISLSLCHKYKSSWLLIWLISLSLKYGNYNNYHKANVIMSTYFIWTYHRMAISWCHKYKNSWLLIWLISQSLKYGNYSNYHKANVIMSTYFIWTYHRILVI